MIRSAESELFALYDIAVEESYLELPRAGARLRVLSAGAGPAIVFLHGVTLTAAVWAGLLPALAGYRVHLVELPGHGLSSPLAYRRGAVRGHTVRLLEDLLDALGLESAAMVGHSLGGMFSLWLASERPQRVASLVVIGDPAVALPGVTVRMPLSLMTVPLLGPLFLRAPLPRPVYRRLFGQAMSRAAAAAAPEALLDVLRFSNRRSDNAKTVASLMHATSGFRRPHQTSVLGDAELPGIDVPTAFLWGREEPFLSQAEARPSIVKMPAAILHEVEGGHGPWFEDPAGCAALITEHLSKTGFPALPSVI